MSAVACRIVETGKDVQGRIFDVEDLRLSSECCARNCCFEAEGVSLNILKVLCHR